MPVLPPYDPLNPASYAQIARECGDLKAALFQRDEYRRSLIHTAASLAAAISLLERGSKQAAPSNKMFDQMLSDYRAALQSARDTLNS